MTSPRERPGAAVVTAMLAAGAIGAQFIAGKATSKALYLAQYDYTTLPAMSAAAALFSVGLVVLSSKILKRVSPATVVPNAFAASAILLLAEWGLTFTSARPLVPVVVYLHISGLGPMLGSGFWLIATERFDPRTAKKRFGQIAGAGTLGGLLCTPFGLLVAANFDIAAMLPVLAALNIVCAWQIRRLARPIDPRLPSHAIKLAPDLVPVPFRSGLRALAEAPYLRNLAALVLIGTIGAALLDYVFSWQAVVRYGRGEKLLQFFLIYQTATSLLTLVVQTSSTRLALKKLGLAFSTATPSLALFAGGIGALLAPEAQRLLSTMVARAVESVFRGSLFRSGYELFYTPLSVGEKRAAKSIIDVGFDRLGELLGAAVIWLVLLSMAPAGQYTAILFVAVACSSGALILASRLSGEYIQALERSLLGRAVELELADVEDLTTRTVMIRSLGISRAGAVAAGRGEGGAPQSKPATPVMVSGNDPELRDIMTLRSRDRSAILRVLQHEEGLAASLVSHVIPLLAWDPVTDAAVSALRKVAEERVGELIDVLIDPNQSFAVRRRLARVFSVCVSQRPADGLLLGLGDLRFEVRFQCGRSLAAILERNPRVRLDKERVYEVVRREVAAGRSVWEARQLLDQLDDADQKPFLDDFVKNRASQSLAHVFTLLSLVLPAEPLRIAFRGLHTDDQSLRGTALEYLEGVLPPAVRERLWPFLEDRRSGARATRSREEILADLLRSNQSITLNLEDLKRRAGSAETA